MAFNLGKRLEGAIQSKVGSIPSEEVAIPAQEGGSSQDSQNLSKMMLIKKTFEVSIILR